MKNIPLLVGTIVGTIVLVVGVALFFSNSNPSPGSGQNQDQNQVADPEILLSSANVKGPEDAQVTIVEFSDFQCPACRSVAPLIEQVAAQYPEQVRVMYRHFPLSSIHPNAQLAAQAAEAAAEYSQFWEMHDLLFERQEEWSTISSQEKLIDTFVTYAAELAIDTGEFREKIVSEDIKQRVLEDIVDGSSLSINATPTIYVNNQKLPAPHQLSTVVESVLNSQQ